MTSTCEIHAPTRPVTRRRPFLGLIGRIFAVRRQRRALLDLSDHHLADIGLTRSQAQSEATRPTWDVPANWRM